VSEMLFIVVSTVIAMSFGFLLGAFVASRLLWQKKRRLRRPFVRRSSGYQSDGYIDQAAEQWAHAQGRPAAAPLVARKLRLLQSIAERRSRGWRS
jgi:hypothetical protein